MTGDVLPIRRSNPNARASPVIGRGVDWPLEVRDALTRARCPAFDVTSVRGQLSTVTMSDAARRGIKASWWQHPKVATNSKRVATVPAR